jgi:hypothetical protein
VRRLVIILVSTLMALVGWPVSAPAADDDLAVTASKYLDRLFIVTCAYSHSSSDDPIGKPGQPGASHHHDFFGNTSTDAFSTVDSMLAAGTTCNRAGDTAGYWMPSVMEDGEPVTPGVATFYYRAPGPDPSAVQAFPEDFRMIAGDPEATSAQRLKVVEWACRDEGAKKPWRADIRSARQDRRWPSAPTSPTAGTARIPTAPTTGPTSRTATATGSAPRPSRCTCPRSR